MGQFLGGFQLFIVFPVDLRHAPACTGMNDLQDMIIKAEEDMMENTFNEMRGAQNSAQSRLKDGSQGESMNDQAT